MYERHVRVKACGKPSQNPQGRGPRRSQRAEKSLALSQQKGYHVEHYYSTVDRHGRSMTCIVCRTRAANCDVVCQELLQQHERRRRQLYTYLHLARAGGLAFIYLPESYLAGLTPDSQGGSGTVSTVYPTRRDVNTYQYSRVRR